MVAESLNIDNQLRVNSSSLPRTKTIKIIIKKKQNCCNKNSQFLLHSVSSNVVTTYLQGISNEKVIKDSSQVPRNKSLKIFHQNIRGLGNKANELYCHLHHHLPHILCLSEHHLSESELILTHLTNYSLGASYCRKTFLKGCVSVFVYRNLKYNTINIDEYNIDKDIEACAIQLDSTFNKLCILAIYGSPRGDFTNFLTCPAHLIHLNFIT